MISWHRIVELNRLYCFVCVCRFITWVFQSVKYTAQCNIIAFVYLKRIISSKRMLTIRNWRALWIGAIIVAQKFIDDVCVRTSSFCEILPGVSRQQLKAVELCVFELMDYCGRIKPSVYAQFFFELRMIFEAITGQMVAQRITNFSAQCPPLRPLSREQGNALIEEPAIPRRGRTVSQSDASENNSSISGGAGPETSEFRLPPTSSRASSVTATTAGVKQSSTAHSDAVTRLPPLASVKQQHKPRQQSGSSRSSRSSKGHNKKERSITADDIHYALSKGVFIIN